MKISVSFITSLYGEQETIKKINESNADLIHIDIMDGKFVPVKNYDFTTISYLFYGIKKDLDVHLMVEDPMEDVKKYVLLRPKYITFHLEASDNPKEIIDFIHSRRIKAGLAINPETSIDDIIPYLDDIDLVLIMGVNPGYGGQKYIKDTTNKINELNKYKKDHNFIVSVDGGINNKTIKDIDIDIAVSGAYVCTKKDYNKQIDKLRIK